MMPPSLVGVDSSGARQSHIDPLLSITRRPFLDLLDVDSKETRRIWQSEPPFYEYTSSILSDLVGCG